MKRLMVLALFAFGIVSCSGCAKKGQPPEVVNHPAPAPVVTPPAPLPPVSVTVKKQGPTWEFTLPSNDWVNSPEAPEGFVLLFNPVLSNMISFENFEYSGNLDSLVLNNLREMRNKEIVIHAAKQVEINGTRFVLVEATKGNSQAFIWMATFNNRAYALTCGGDVNVPFKDLCTSVANTIKLH